MLSTIISILVGGIIAFGIAKWQLQKNRIDHYFINSYDIGKGLSADFPKFTLHYGDEILSNNVRIINGGFMNTGNNDIGENGNQIEIKLVLPDNYTVKEVKVLTAVKDLIITPVIGIGDKKNVIIFKICGLLKIDEYFEYSFIFESPESFKGIEDRLTFEHRIKNTRPIKNIYIGRIQRMGKAKKRLKWLFVTYGLSGLMIVLSGLYSGMRFKVYQNETRNEVDVRIGTNSNIYVVDHNSLPYISETKITQEEFDNNYVIVPLVSYNWFKLIFSLIFCVLVIVLISINYYLYYGGKKGYIIRVLKNNNKHN